MRGVELEVTRLDGTIENDSVPDGIRGEIADAARFDEAPAFTVV